MKGVRLLGCFVLTLLVVSTSSAATPPAGRAVPLTKVTVAVLPVEQTALAFYAKERGFFRQQGIDVKLTPLYDPAQIVAAVLSGHAQFSSINTGAIATLKSKHAPVRVVAAGALHRRVAPTTALVAAPGQTITRVQDLIGKPIAIDAPNNLAHVGLLRWLKRNGVSGKRVRLIQIPFAQMLGALTHGSVVAAVLPEPFLTLALQNGAKRVAYIFKSVCPENCLLVFYMARKDVDAGLAARFRTAIQAAAVWANRERNDRRSGELLARYTGLDAAVIAKVTRTRFAVRLKPGLAQPWIDAFAEFGVIPKRFPASDLLK